MKRKRLEKQENALLNDIKQIHNAYNYNIQIKFEFDYALFITHELYLVEFLSLIVYVICQMFVML